MLNVPTFKSVSWTPSWRQHVGLALDASRPYVSSKTEYQRALFKPLTELKHTLCAYAYLWRRPIIHQGARRPLSLILTTDLKLAISSNTL